jgi:hypothetical protein
LAKEPSPDDRHAKRQRNNERLEVHWGSAACPITELICEKIVLIELATPGIIAPAATATNPAIKAYSIKSCPFLLRGSAAIKNQSVFTI